MEELLGISLKRLIAWIEVVLIIIFSFLALGLFLSPNSTPDSTLLWSLKRTQEKLFMKFESTVQGKLTYQRSLLNVRLNEISSITNSRHYDYELPSSLRYSTLAGQITELIINNQLKDQADSVKKRFREHKKILNELYVAYPKNTENIEYKYIEDDINYLDLYLDKLAKI